MVVTLKLNLDAPTITVMVLIDNLRVDAIVLIIIIMIVPFIQVVKNVHMIIVAEAMMDAM
jgi:hypothetical protein